MFWNTSLLSKGLNGFSQAPSVAWAKMISCAQPV